MLHKNRLYFREKILRHSVLNDLYHRPMNIINPLIGDQKAWPTVQYSISSQTFSVRPTFGSWKKWMKWIPRPWISWFAFILFGKLFNKKGNYEVSSDKTLYWTKKRIQAKQTRVADFVAQNKFSESTGWCRAASLPFLWVVRHALAYQLSFAPDLIWSCLFIWYFHQWSSSVSGQISKLSLWLMSRWKLHQVSSLDEIMSSGFRADLCLNIISEKFHSFWNWFDFMCQIS